MHYCDDVRDKSSAKDEPAIHDPVAIQQHPGDQAVRLARKVKRKAFGLRRAQRAATEDGEERKKKV